jgi:alpha-L-fucosidase
VKGEKVYLHVFSWPADGILRVSRLKNEVRSAYPLLDPSRKLKASRRDGVISVDLPPGNHDENDTVIALELAGKPEVEPPILTQSSDAAFELDYMTASTAGKTAKRFNRDGKFHISKWTGPGDSATWRLLISQAGKYQVRIRYAARTEWAGAKYVVDVGPHSLTGAVERTGDWYSYRTFELGTVSIAKAGEYAVSIRPAADSDRNLMYFQSLVLEPAGLTTINE